LVGKRKKREERNEGSRYRVETQKLKEEENCDIVTLVVFQLFFFEFFSLKTL